MNILDQENQTLVRESWCWAAEAVKNSIIEHASEQSRPCVLMRPTLKPDGDQWCALHGSDLQEGVAGFGRSPHEAMRDFDNKWYAKLNPLAK